MASALQSKKQCYTERNSLRYREITAQSIQRMQILHRGFFMPAFDRILQLARMEEMDCEFVEVTAHEGARRAGPVRLELPPQLLPVLSRRICPQLHG